MKTPVYATVGPDERTLRGRILYEARVRRVFGDLLNDRLLTITSEDREAARIAVTAAANALQRAERKARRPR